MSVNEVKAWMDRNNVRVTDIAHELQVHPQTVYKYLQGKAVHRSTIIAIQRLAQSNFTTHFAGKNTYKQDSA